MSDLYPKTLSQTDSFDLGRISIIPRTGNPSTHDQESHSISLIENADETCLQSFVCPKGKMVGIAVGCFQCCNKVEADESLRELPLKAELAVTLGQSLTH